MQGDALRIFLFRKLIPPHQRPPTGVLRKEVAGNIRCIASSQAPQTAHENRKLHLFIRGRAKPSLYPSPHHFIRRLSRAHSPRSGFRFTGRKLSEEDSEEAMLLTYSAGKQTQTATNAMQCARAERFLFKTDLGNLSEMSCHTMSFRVFSGTSECGYCINGRCVAGVGVL